VLRHLASCHATWLADGVQGRSSCFHSAQSQLLLLAMKLMRGGSLRAALLHPERKRLLAWSARQAALPECSGERWVLLPALFPTSPFQP
jgi:hypothetical protein